MLHSKNNLFKLWVKHCPTVHLRLKHLHQSVIHYCQIFGSRGNGCSCFPLHYPPSSKEQLAFSSPPDLFTLGLFHIVCCLTSHCILLIFVSPHTPCPLLPRPICCFSSLPSSYIYPTSPKRLPLAACNLWIRFLLVILAIVNSWWTGLTRPLRLRSAK